MNEKITLKFRKNGPILVYRGSELVAALCRCGNSTKKPYCSGAHKEVGFQADEHTLEL